MTNTTNKTRNAEILNAIESELWRAVDAINDAEDSRFQNKWGREEMMIGRWFNLMVECGKFDEDATNSQEVKDALEGLWSDVLPGIIKTQAAAFYDALDSASVLDGYEALLEYFYLDGGADHIFSVDSNEDESDVEITADENFSGYMADFVAEYQG